MAIGRWWRCYLACCSDGSRSFLVILCSLMVRCQLAVIGDFIKLDVLMKLVATGDVM